MKKEVNVAVVGATGAVGTEMIKTLEQRQFPVKELRPLASARSAGQEISFRGKKILCQELTEHSFEGIDIALFSAGGSVSEQFCPIAVKAGAVCVDNTSAFRMDPNTPLVVPEVNPEKIKEHKGIIANPNCSTIQMVVVLKPLHDALKIKRIIVSTYQAVSGAGTRAMNELKTQLADFVSGNDMVKEVFPHQIAMNVLPQIDVFLDNGYTKEEMKMIKETQKILGDQSLSITATTVRVPVLRAHSESVTIETEKELPLDEIRSLLSKAPGVKVVDDPSQKVYPMPIDAAFKDETLVGRLRKDLCFDKGYSMWVVSDNLRKGAALNAVQIAEHLCA